MSLKNSYTTSNYLQWDSATTLVRKLYRDKNYRISLLIGCGLFFGLRISDLLRLTWNMLLNSEAKFVLIEKKTGKRREVKINKEFQKHIKDCLEALFCVMDKPCPQRVERPLQLEDKTLLHTFTKKDLWQKSV